MKQLPRKLTKASQQASVMFVFLTLETSSGVSVRQFPMIITHLMWLLIRPYSPMVNIFFIHSLLFNNLTPSSLSAVIINCRQE